MTLLSIGLLNGCAEEAKAPSISEENAGIVENDTQTTDQKTITEEEAQPQQDGQEFDQLAPPEAGEKVAVIETDFGTIKLKLFTDLAPEMTKNFEELVKAGNYNNVPFHRVVKDFMIQTGDFTNKNGTGGYSYKGPGTMLPDEITPQLEHLYGTVSMANRGPDTNGSQFFIVTNKQGTSFLNGSYTIFGQVYEGMDVAEKIADLQKSGTEMPSEEVNMVKVEVMQL